jgi:Condensation domain
VPLDERRLREVLRDLLRRHETLRTSFVFDEYPMPMQLVHDPVEPELEIGADIGETAFDDWFEHEKFTAFRWDRPGLIRFFAHSRGLGAFTLTVSFHHAVIDGWSLSLFIRDLVRTYLAGAVALEPAGAAPSYRDFVRAELRTRDSRAAREFWVRTVAGAPPAILVDRSDAARDARWSEAVVVLDAATQRELSRIATGSGTPLKHILLACHLSVLRELTGEADVTTGVVTNGRLEVEGGEDAVGLFLNFLPLRQEITARTWGELVREVFEQNHRAVPHRRYPLALIRQACGRDRLFSAIFNYTQFKAYAELPELTGIRWFEHTEFPLLVNVGHDLSAERIVITLNADGRQFSQKWVENVGSVFSATIDRLVNTGLDAPVSSGGPR